MALHVQENPLSNQLLPFDNQVTKSDDPLPTGSHIVHIFSGKRGSGKSTLMLNLLHRKSSPYYRWFDNIYMVSPTARRDEKWKDLVDEIDSEGHFWTKLDEQTVDEIVTQVTEYNDERMKVKKDKKTGKETKPKGPPPRNLLILDDCLNAIPGSHMKSSINDLFTNGRHMKLTVWITTQKLNKLNTVIRSNTDLISFFQTDNAKEFECLENEWSIDKKRLERLYAFATNEQNSFLHISFFGRAPTFYKKFSRIVEE